MPIAPSPNRASRPGRHPLAMDWACLNDASQPPDDVERLARRTAEAEESRLISSYEHAVRRAASGNAHEAIESLRAVLAHALTNREDVSARLLRVKFLSLKNLGRLLDERGTAASEDDEAARTDREEAVRCYASAVEIDDTDALVWGRLGRAAVAVGSMAVARMAYERAVSASPRNQLFLEDLSEVCLSAGDFETAKALAGAVMEIDPGNARARAMKRARTTKRGMM